MEKALRKWWPVFLLPTVLAFIIGFAWPFVQGLYLSFCKFTTIDRAAWNGIENYIFALKDPDFLHSFLSKGGEEPPYFTAISKLPKTMRF